MKELVHAPLLLATLLAAPACGSDRTGADDGGAHLRIAVSPLSLPGLSDACYDLAVFNARDPSAGQTVWSKTGICADRYGDHAGSVSYVGSCDASGPGGQRDTAVRLVLTDLCSGGPCVVPGPGPTSLASASYENPCPAPDGCVIVEPCKENADTPVTFDLVVLRGANQGFFDVVVSFEDIFCSAKLDCAGENGPIKLLHNPTSGEPDTTVVLGFACTSGAGKETWLYMNDVEITCYDAGGAVASTVGIDPSEGPGNMGGHGSLLFQTASYRGSEALAPYEKCYWNLAFGVNQAALGPRCRLSVRATAADHELSGRHTPDGAVYPVIDWSVDLNTAAGALSCGKQSVNAEGSHVTTDYTAASGEAFDHFVACDDPGTAGGTPGRFLCDGQVAGVDELATFTVTDGKLVADVGGVQSGAYSLPPDTGLGGCCYDPCCSE
ncbi:MAG: hypothetical protein U1F43_17175 [Myxococcota bacterium]